MNDLALQSRGEPLVAALGGVDLQEGPTEDHQVLEADAQGGYPLFVVGRSLDQEKVVCDGAESGEESGCQVGVEVGRGEAGHVRATGKGGERIRQGFEDLQQIDGGNRRKR